MTTLKTLDEHERERREDFERAEAANHYPRPNGIACPKCGEELMDSDMLVLTSQPPMKNVHCPACGYRGYRTY